MILCDYLFAYSVYDTRLVGKPLVQVPSGYDHLLQQPQANTIHLGAVGLRTGCSRLAHRCYASKLHCAFAMDSWVRSCVCSCQSLVEQLHSCGYYSMDLHNCASVIKDMIHLSLALGLAGIISCCYVMLLATVTMVGVFFYEDTRINYENNRINHGLCAKLRNGHTTFSNAYVQQHNMCADNCSTQFILTWPLTEQSPRSLFQMILYNIQLRFHIAVALHTTTSITSTTE